MATLSIQREPAFTVGLQLLILHAKSVFGKYRQGFLRVCVSNYKMKCNFASHVVVVYVCLSVQLYISSSLLPAI